MLKILISKFNKNFLYISFTIFLLLNLPILGNLPYSDDIHHIFQHSYITSAQNPFVFLNPWGEYFKSWGLTYSVLWSLYTLFGSNYIYFRLFNIALHFINHMLFRRFINENLKFSKEKSNWISILFLFNPLVILTTNWIFQIKTLLSVFFLLLILIHIHRSNFKKTKDFLITYALFFLSLVSKITAILLPLYLLFFLKDKISPKKLILLFIPTILLSTTYGLINIKGITYLKDEVKNINKPTPELTIKTDFSEGGLRVANQIKEKKVDHEFKIFKEMLDGANHYFTPLEQENSFYDKHIISMQNLGRLVLNSVGLNNYYPFYEDNLKTSRSNLTYLYVLIAIIFIFALIKTRNHFLFLTLLLFIPISGYFYVPYMKYSFTSDHWFYPAMIPLLCSIFYFLKDTKILIGITCSILFSFLITTYKYTDFDKLLISNFNHNKNRFILENISNNNSTFQDEAKIYDYLLSSVDFNNVNYYKILFNTAKRLNNAPLARKHFARFAANNINSKDSKSLSYFTYMHSGVLTDDKLYLTNTLSIIFTRKINRKTYDKIVSKLK